MTSPLKNNSNNNNNNYNIHTTPDPTEQKPEGETSNYTSTTLWGIGKVFQYGVLTPFKKIGQGAEFLENYLFNAEETQLNLEDRDITHTGEDTKISRNQLLKIMQGQKIDRDMKVTELENQITELKRQLKEFQDAQQQEPEDSISSEKQIVSPELREREELEKPARGDGSPRKAGQGIQFNKVESDSDSETNTTTPTSTKTTQDTSDSVIQEFTSPLYDGEDQADILRQIEKVLDEKTPSVKLNVLFDNPPPVPRAIAGASRGRGGPAKKGETRSNDEALLTRLNVTAATLQQRRDAFLVVHKELADYIKTTGTEIRDIKAKNSEVINKAFSFEKSRPENLAKLSIMQNEDLLAAKTKYNEFSQLIEKYQDLKKTDPEAAAQMKIKFSNEIGQGEKKQVKIVYQTLEEVVEKRLIEGYKQDVTNIEEGIKNQIKSINSTTELFAGKIYPQKLKYKRAEWTDNKEITIAEVLNLEKNIRVARDKLEVLRDNMKVYKVELPKEVVEVVVEELTPEQKELEEQLKKELKEKREKELQDKVGALKPGNVSAYSFELVDEG